MLKQANLSDDEIQAIFDEIEIWLGDGVIIPEDQNWHRYFESGFTVEGFAGQRCFANLWIGNRTNHGIDLDLWYWRQAQDDNIASRKAPTFPQA